MGVGHGGFVVGGLWWVCSGWVVVGGLWWVGRGESWWCNGGGGLFIWLLLL